MLDDHREWYSAGAGTRNRQGLLVVLGSNFLAQLILDTIQEMGWMNIELGRFAARFRV
jgi:hypothetical protein